MKYMFIIQGDGRGHMTQAITLSEILQRNGHEVSEVLVGKSKTREIPQFFQKKINAKVRTFDTFSFIFRKNKKQIHPLKTMLYNVSPKRIRKYKKSMELINRRILKNNPDVVINFYEILAGLTNLRFSIKTPFINIGHQYLLKHPDYEHAKGDDPGMLLFRMHTLLCGVRAIKTLALSFYPIKDHIADRIAVVPPLIRKEVLDIKPEEGNFVLGYMLNQGYEKEVRQWHKANPDTELHFFWDKTGAPKETVIDKKFVLHALDDELFVQYMAKCRAYITTAGFESVCEAMYLDKPVMMIPTHVEQSVNASDAASINAGITGEDFDISKLLDYMKSNERINNNTFREWVNSSEEIFLKHLTILV